MACRAIHRWTLCSLVGAYIDLALAYLFLCGAALTFFASKFLALFGLTLPCPCNGLFGYCLLVDYPTSKIASLHLALRTRFPFDSIFPYVEFLRDRRLLEMAAGDESSQNLGLPSPLPVTHELELGNSSSSRRARASDVKSKGVLLRRRRRASASLSQREKSPLLSSPSSPRFGCSFSRTQQKGMPAESSAPMVLDDHIGLVDEAAPATECCTVEEEASSGVRQLHGSNGNEQVIRLERALEEEQAPHAALYLELEKERNAAATAADEAMAMILRLQNEKAAIEMEARQYQRIIEEKSAYDQEEMEILKEIIVRRERDKHFLEKEVEAYRQMMLPGGDMTVQKPDSSFDLSDDPELMLQAICESIGKKEKVNDKMHGEDGRRPLIATSTGEHYPQLPDPRDECNLEFQEKGMVTMEVSPSSAKNQICNYREDSIVYQLNGTQELVGHKQTSLLTRKEDCEIESKIELRVHFDDLCREDNQDAEQSSDSSQFETESSVHDVHVIDDKHNLVDKGNGKENVSSQMGCALDISGKADLKNEPYGSSIVDLSAKNRVTSWVGVEGDIQRSCSHMTKGGQLMDSLFDKDSCFDLRRSSLSAVDSERFKLEMEVEVLRKRLKTIEQGRENLSFTVEHREKETFHLQLEEVASQLQEIRKITKPGKSVRQASLPPQSSKVNLKKRRCHSVPWGVNGSA